MIVDPSLQHESPAGPEENRQLKMNFIFIIRDGRIALAAKLPKIDDFGNTLSIF